MSSKYGNDVTITNYLLFVAVIVTFILESNVLVVIDQEVATIVAIITFCYFSSEKKALTKDILLALTFQLFKSILNWLPF